MAATPRDACAAAGCHATDLPEVITLSTVRFNHRSHGGTGTVALGCAGCHGHRRGGEPLTGGSEACGLCHASELQGTHGEDCRTCHRSPMHYGITSQGAVVPHQDLPWIEGECVRCHYDVAAPRSSVSPARCGACHDDRTATLASGVGRDLHPSHAGFGCTSCHEGDTHHIEAMSSSVDLRCDDCHGSAHSVPFASGTVASTACNFCHRSEHVEQQRMVLGLVPGEPRAVPSAKFLAGLTCRSCHLPPERNVDASKPRLGTGRACVGCHRPEYATVLRWWQEGARARLALARRYVGRAQADLAAGRRPSRSGGGTGAYPEIADSLAEAGALLDLVDVGKVQHNLPLAHHLFVRVVTLVGTAYRSSGAAPPPAPELGPRPRMGFCVYCHYRLREPGLARDMNDAFHREVMGKR